MVTRLRVHGGDIDLLARQQLRDVAQQALSIARLDDDVDRKYLLALRAPIGVDQSLRLAAANARHVGARCAVDRDALAARDEADDRVGRRRLAAARKAGQQAIDTDDENPLAAVRRATASRNDL